DVVDDDRRDTLDGPGAEDGDGPGGDGGRGVVVPVGELADAGDVEAAGTALARVRADDAVDHDSGRVVAAVDLTPGELADVREGQGDHEAPPTAAAASARRTVSRSSNGWITPPISCPFSWPLPRTTTVSTVSVLS